MFAILIFKKIFFEHMNESSSKILNDPTPKSILSLHFIAKNILFILYKMFAYLARLMAKIE